MFIAIIPILASILLVLILRRRLLVVSVSGSSMEPSYSSGDRLLAVRRISQELRPGQVIVIDTAPESENPGPPVNIVKRIIAVGGQDVPFARSGDMQGAKVPSGHVYVLGDNRRRSLDSRHFGFFQSDKVVAIVLRRMSAR